jgi:ABC-type multidrug transport system fused ATPase/permease subunit
MDLLQNYLHRQIQLLPGSDYRDIQQAALYEFSKLSSPSVGPVIKHIESAYNKIKNETEVTYRQAKERLDNEYKSTSSGFQNGSLDQIKKLKEEYEQQKHNLERHAKHEKEETARSTEHEIQNFKANYEYETMIAEVVKKGQLKKCQDKINEIKEYVTAKAKPEFEELYQNAKQFISSFDIAIVEDKTGNCPQVNADRENDPLEFCKQQKEAAELYLNTLYDLPLPKLILSSMKYVAAAIICLIFAGITMLIGKNILALNAMNITIIVLVVLAASVVFLLLSEKFLRKKALSQLDYYFLAIKGSAETANKVLDSYLQKSLEQIELEIFNTNEKYKNECENAHKKYHDLKTDSKQNNETRVKSINERLTQICSQNEKSLNEKVKQIEAHESSEQKAYRTQYEDKLSKIQNEFEQKTQQAEAEHNSMLEQLKNYWAESLKTIKTMLVETKQLDQSMFYDWQNAYWQQWSPSKAKQQLIRLGEIKIDFNQIAQQVRELMDPEMQTIETFSVPAVLSFPNRCSLFVQTPHKARDSAIDIVKSAMTRLFTSVPAGQVHFNIFDPVGLGKSFVGFMHAADYEKSLVGGRIWTDSEHIQQQLAELTVHMENVIQKYLRNEFETIEAYNQQAGELAEPYRFLVIADFLTNFSDESVRRLNSIIHSGPRCGVYTFIICDEGRKLPEGMSAQFLASNGIHLLWQKDSFVWQNEVYKKFPLNLDNPPAEETLTNLVRKVGEASIDSSRVEIPFTAIAPTQEHQWGLDSISDIKIPIGRSGARRLQYLQLGKGVNQHILIAGKTGSGKSTLFHVIITNIAMWYSPDEVELYLIDFKQGVEFKTYATHKTPHVRAVAIESDREFGLSILQKLDAEMITRGEEFRQARVQDISSYRQTTGKKMPRTILIIDEFHILFSEDDKISHTSTILLEKLVRQGRAFGIHIILGSQSLAGISGISRSIMGQMAVRIALQCSEVDSQIIFNEDNVVARLLSRPGEAIYNDAGGMVVGNNPFQIAWLPKLVQDEYLTDINNMPEKTTLPREQMIVFEGNVPADISNNSMLAKLIQNPFYNDSPANQPPFAWLGEPVRIKDPTSVMFNRQNGANLLITGQQDIAMAGVLSSALLSLLLGLSPKVSKFIVMNGSSADSLINIKMKMIDSFIPNRCQFVQFGQIEEAISGLAAEVQKRLAENIYDGPIEFLFISGLQRYRMLHKKEEDWSMSSEQNSISLDKQLTNIISDGPAVGIHTIIGVDTFGMLEKVLGRKTLGEFNNQVLFQMSNADSSSLIDSPIANKLGFQQALFYNQEQGIFEKFRFYAPPDENWLRNILHK